MRNLVLTFHSIQDAEWFEETLRFIEKWYTFGTLDELYDRLINRKFKPRRMCFLTFDDGERSVYNVVFPILKRLHIPAAMFVSPKNVVEGGAFWFQRMRCLEASNEEAMKDKPLADILAYIHKLDPQDATNVNENIDKEMFDTLVASGLITFGAHTQHHPILANETDEVAFAEISDSVRDLERLLGTKVLYFAYPNGSRRDFSEREVEILHQCGVVMAFSTIPGYATNKEMYAIQRIGITYGTRWHIMFKLLFPKAFVSIRYWKSRLLRKS